MCSLLPKRSLGLLMYKIWNLNILLIQIADTKFKENYYNQAVGEDSLTPTDEYFTIVIIEVLLLDVLCNPAHPLPDKNYYLLRFY